ncbi:SRPBCC family protein [Undibacterium sp. TJN25]|uniref:SRPBCC family protein n=1 Tax=Undibacterium sp. TJN25 TaxID=3413056 RepID=UPI003BF099B2
MIVEYSVEIDASIEDVYRISQDYSVRYLWDPFPEKIEMLHGEQEIRPGTEVRVLAKSGIQMEVRFVQCRPPEVAAVTMTKGPFFLSHFAGSWTFRARADVGTLARFKYSLKMKRWALPWLSEKIASFYFRRKIIERMSGLKHYCEQENTLAV